MKVSDLNSDQLIQLKQRYFIEQHGEPPTLQELIEIDDIVSDGEIMEEFADCEFHEDDFFWREDGENDE